LSHSNIRKEKVCLNCNAALTESFCPRCGQKNLEPKESIWDLINHFFHNITHYDGKIFTTLKLLVVKPGFLSREYLRGRRAAYLHPIHLYVLTSTVFFILFFSIFQFKKPVNAGQQLTEGRKSDSLYGNWTNARTFALKNSNSHADSAHVEQAVKSLGETSFGAMVDSIDKTKMRSPFIHLMNTGFNTKPDYYSAQQRLPESARDGWIVKRVTYKRIEVTRNIEKDADLFFDYWLNNLLHMLPQLLFVSLPLFALLLKFLYWRRTSYYSEHAIFSIHLYIFTFVSLLVYLSFSKLQDVFHWGWIRYILGILLLYILFYSYQAMRNFYQQGFIKTFIKYCLLHFMSFTVILVLFVMFFMLSIFQ
jgi:hypothetical protein